MVERGASDDDRSAKGVHTTPQCPRCGYDQRGEISTWNKQGTCPLESICAECGLSFAWGDLLNPNLAIPKWCVEAQRRWWHWPWQFVRTSARAWWPILLWRPLRMEHPPRWRRQVMFVGAWLIALWLVIMLCNGVLVVVAAQSLTKFRPPAAIATTGPWPVFAQAALMPWSAHSVGSWGYLQPSMVAATTSGGRVTMPARMVRIPYPAPRDHLISLLRPWQPLLLLLSTPLTTALAFAALPVSRRRAKVRWQHIRRAAVYGCALAGVVTMSVLLGRAWVLIDAYAGSRSGTPSSPGLAGLISAIASLATMAAIVCSIAFPFVLGFYWWSCAALHLRMQQAWAVAISVVVIGLLASVAVAFWLGEWIR